MSAWIPFIIVTAFWAVFGAGGPFLVPSGVNRGFFKLLFHFYFKIFPFFSILFFRYYTNNDCIDCCLLLYVLVNCLSSSIKSFDRPTASSKDDILDSAKMGKRSPILINIWINGCFSDFYFLFTNVFTCHI